MARGYPDFYGYEIVPKYGTPVDEIKAAAIVVTGNWETVFNITGKGRTYGGYIVLSSILEAFTTALLRVIIDGVTFTLLTPAVELAYNINSKVAQPFSLTRYQQTALSQSIVWTGERDWTFGMSFFVEVYQNSGANATVEGDFLWGRVV